MIKLISAKKKTDSQGNKDLQNKVLVLRRIWKPAPTTLSKPHTGYVATKLHTDQGSCRQDLSRHFGPMRPGAGWVVGGDVMAWWLGEWRWWEAGAGVGGR